MSDEIVVQVLPTPYALHGRAHVQIAFDLWGKPGVAEAIGKAIQAAFDKPPSSTADGDTTNSSDPTTKGS
jgi:hypothetical protein